MTWDCAKDRWTIRDVTSQANTWCIPQSKTDNAWQYVGAPKLSEHLWPIRSVWCHWDLCGLCFSLESFERMLRLWDCGSVEAKSVPWVIPEHFLRGVGVLSFWCPSCHQGLLVACSGWVMNGTNLSFEASNWKCLQMEIKNSAEWHMTRCKI